MVQILKLLGVCFFAAMCTMYISAQAEDSFSFDYELKPVYEPLSISKTTLLEAKDLSGLNSYFKEEWVQDYVSVKISAIHDGQVKSVTSPDNILNEEQKRLMYSADSGTDISIVVDYLPQNDLKNNEAKREDYSFMVNPEINAHYGDGQEALLAYTKTKLIDLVSWDSLGQYQMAVVEFVVDKEGYILNPELKWSSDDETADAQMLEFVCNMPRWAPAQYEDGVKIDQSYVLTIGDTRSCVINTLNTKSK